MFVMLTSIVPFLHLPAMTVAGSLLRQSVSEYGYGRKVVSIGDPAFYIAMNIAYVMSRTGSAVKPT